MRKSSKFVWLVVVLSGLFVFSCNRQTDYYTLLIQEGCEAQTNELTNSCREAMIKRGKIDLASFRGHEDVLEALFQGMSQLMYAPLAYPKDKKIFGLATFEEAQMYDFIDTFLQDEHANFNQLVLNYVLNSASSFKYQCFSGPNSGAAAFYQYGVIHLCDSFALELLAVSRAATLLHEARHQAVNHSVECKGELECDKGMDGAHGWWIGFAWGALQGNGQNPYLQNTTLSGDGLDNLVREMSRKTREFIFALPALLNPAKDPDFEEQYAKFFPQLEQLQYPFAARQVGFDTSFVPIPKGPHLLTMKTGDFNADGKLDLALASVDQVDVLLNQGDLKFIQASSTSLQRCGTLRTLASADFDGDHQVDLMIACDSIRILWGNGDGHFTAEYNTYLSSDFLYYTQIADLNQDQKLDLIFINSGRMNVEVALSMPGRKFALLSYQPNKIGNQLVFDLAVADMNQDRIPDLITNWSSNNIAVSLGQGDGRFAADPLWTQVDGTAVVKVIDMNQDHRPDLLIESTYQGSHTLQLGLADGTFLPPSGIEFPADLYSQQIEAADFNQDGYTDLMAFPRSKGIPWTLSYGSAFSNVRRTLHISVEYMPQPEDDFVIGDLNQDGLPDVALLSTSGEVLLYISKLINPTFGKLQ